MATANLRARRLRVTVTPRKGWLHPLDRALCESSGVRPEAFHGVCWLADETAITLAEVSGPVDRIEAACTATDEVISHTVSPLDDGCLVFAWIEPTPVVERMLQLRHETDIVAQPPFEWTESGSLQVDVFGPATRIEDVGDRLSEDVDVSVDPVDAPTEDGLTAVHYTVLEAAFDGGYYDTPRSTTLDDVAASVGATRETTERRLREAESRLFARAVAAAAD